MINYIARDLQNDDSKKGNLFGYEYKPVFNQKIGEYSSSSPVDEDECLQLDGAENLFNIPEDWDGSPLKIIGDKLTVVKE